ncbi:C39 family peptidase [Amycolatopsis anabasis]|uniref:C39 family peptidase n=1 Tax=Amycolatopsis anabasis TaxID=1840409 RepID=UPI00131CCE0C|nr:C39 family peptidase [Amycolatopsis anabasis]
MKNRLIVTAVAVAAAGVFGFSGVATADVPAAPAAAQVAAKSLDIEYQVQETGYWCGPAAVRIAQSARTRSLPSQGDLAAQMGTTENGTDHISQVANALNANLGGNWYEVKEMPSDPPSPEQKTQLWNDIVYDIDNGYAVVTNIVAPPNNHPPGYPDETIYHYFTVIGYDGGNSTVQIADPASFGGNQIYWLSFDQLASLIPPKGYAA